MNLDVYNKAIRSLLVLTALCVAMQLFRMYGSNTTTFVKLSWNLFLAWVPLLLSMVMMKTEKQWAITGLFISWLLFFPNSPYIITDLIHLGPSPDFPHWYDAMLLYSFAFAGLLTGMLSCLIVFGKLKSYFSISTSRLIMIACMFASGFGVYVGRFLRWNTWDVLVRPMHLLNTTIQHILSPEEYTLAYGVTLLSGCLLSVTFLFFEAFIQLPQEQIKAHDVIEEAPLPAATDINTKEQTKPRAREIMIAVE